MQTPSLTQVLAAALAASTAASGFQAPSTNSVSRRAVAAVAALTVPALAAPLDGEANISDLAARDVADDEDHEDDDADLEKRLPKKKGWLKLKSPWR